MKRTYLFSLIFLLCFSQNIYAQIEDCVGAFPVCGNGDISLSPTGVGADDFALPGNNSPDCRFFESKSIWLRIKIKRAGTLGFNLVPDNNTGPNRDDYDFAIYGPDKPCDNLGSSIRCSSTNPQNANVQAETGMNESEPETSEGPGALGNGFIHWLDNVSVGQVYYILIDNFDQNAGFKLEWTGSALLEDRITKAEGGVDLGNDIKQCGDTPLTLDATTLGGVSYLWNTGESTARIQPNNDGEYIVNVRTATGCVSADTINVEFFPRPIIDRLNATPNNVCEPVDISFNSDGSVGEYKWYFPDGTLAGAGNNIVLDDLMAEQSGNYKLELTSPDGCIVEENIDVTINPLPRTEIIGRTQVCENERITITAQTDGTSIQWLDESDNIVSNTKDLVFNPVSFADAGVYRLIIQTNLGCEEIEVVELEVFPEITVESNQDVQNSCTNETLFLTAIANQTNVNYTWRNPRGEIVGTEAEIELDSLLVEDSGEYTITAINEIGCESFDTIDVKINQAYFFDNDIERCPGDFFTIPQTGQIITQSDTIKVNLLTRENCDSTYNYNVNFLTCGDLVCTGFPTTFAPNANGENDEFRPLFSPSCTPIYFKLDIYNRWGNIIFTTNNSETGWNGKFEQEPAQDGFYLWMMEYTFPDDPENITKQNGGVTLIR